MFFLLLSITTFAGSYDLKFFQSKFFTEKDRAKITRYLSDDYLVLQRQKERTKYSQNLFRYLRDASVEEVRNEIKENPFAGLEWPDNRESLEYLMLKIEN